MQLTRAPESMSASIEKCLKSMGAKSMRLFCLRAIAENSGRHFSPAGLSLVGILVIRFGSSCNSVLSSLC